LTLWLTFAVILVAVTLPVAVAARRAHSRDQRRAGEEALARHDHEAAYTHLQRALTLWSDDGEVNFLAARAARRLKRYDLAREHLQRCSKLGFAEDRLDVEWSLIEVQRGNFAPVEGLWQRVQTEERDRPAILEVLVQHFLDTYQAQRALTALSLYLEDRPGDLRALLARAFVWERLFYFADAVRDYRQAVEQHPESDEAREKLARTLLIASTPSEALEHYQALFEKHPESRSVRLGLARCKRRLNDGAGCRHLLDALLREPPDNPEVLGEYGLLTLQEGKPAEAERWLSKALAQTPHNRELAYNYWQSLLRQGKVKEAKKAEAEVKRLDEVLKRLGEVTREVLKRPNDARLRLEGGLLFLKHGEPEEGVRWLELALRLDPSCEEARRALADLDRGPASPR
jgi:tetratricopeptide (TPR) repeat protein